MARKEKVYIPHFDDGCHECGSKETEGWLVGCQLDDETNRPHGLTELEPVNPGASWLELLLTFASGSLAVFLFDRREIIKDKINLVKAKFDKNQQEIEPRNYKREAPLEIEYEVTQNTDKESNPLTEES